MWLVGYIVQTVGYRVIYVIDIYWCMVFQPHSMHAEIIFRDPIAKLEQAQRERQVGARLLRIIVQIVQLAKANADC